MLRSFEPVLKSIWSNKMRSVLTMFDIVIGVASVIILVSLLNGYMQNQLPQRVDLGAKNINVTVVNQPSRSVSLEDMYAFRDANSTLLEGVSPAVSPGNGTLEVESVKSESTTITDVSETYAALTEKTVAEGRFLSYAGVVAKQEVCMLGAYPAQKLFGFSDAALGQNVTLGGKNLQAIGVLTRKSKGRVEESGTDDVMLLPYPTALRFGGTNKPGAYVFSTVSTDKAQTSVAKQALRDYLYSISHDKKNYHLMAMGEMFDQINKMMVQMSVLMDGIAGISLFVAGVSVMNIMLVPVAERTREAGIRKVLGARPGVILQQFVLEAITTPVFGELIGIGIGGEILNIVTIFLGYSVAATPSAVLILFTASVAIGLLFGYMPIKRAATLNPIDALRSK